MRTLAAKIAFVLLTQTLTILSEDKWSYQSIKRDFSFSISLEPVIWLDCPFGNELSKTNTFNKTQWKPERNVTKFLALIYDCKVQLFYFSIQIRTQYVPKKNNVFRTKDKLMVFIFICSFLKLVSSSFLKKFMLYYGCVLPSCARMRLPVCGVAVRDMGGQNFWLSIRNATVSYLFLPLQALTHPKLLFLQSLLGLQFCNDFHSL